MKNKMKILLILIFLFLVIGAVSANDENSTDIIKNQETEIIDSEINEDLEYNNTNLKESEEDNQLDSSNSTDETIEDLHITTNSNFVKKGSNYNIYLVDGNDEKVANKKLKVILDGKTYEKTTDSNGKISIKVDSSASKTSLEVSYTGDEQYKAFSQIINVYVEKSISMKIGNSKLLTNGYLRIYLSGSTNSIAYKTVKIKIGNKVFTKKTSAEGFIVFKPQMKTGSYKVTVTYGDYSISKTIKCIKGNVIDPFKKTVPKVNGIPDIDWMPGNFVSADNNAKYTLKKSQYREVIKRDSHTLYLYGKLTKYTFFKTKSSPKTYHVIKREKWNVIERALNIKLVKKNKYNYWPKTITVSLKGKSYTYSEVRDVQNKGYTCGPTSASVCSQALRNYYSEKFFQTKGHVVDGINIPVLKKIINQQQFSAKYFYSDSFNSALKQVQKGGAALIAFLPNHYVSIIDVSKDGKKVLVSNSYGKYNVGGASKVPTKWVSVKYFKSKFAGVGLVVKLKYKLSKKEKSNLKNFYKSMGPNFKRQNTNERIPNT